MLADSGGAVKPSAPARSRRFVRLRAASSSRSATTSTASAAMRRKVVSFPPITLTTPLADTLI
jgi:hypothetical protein